MWNFKKKIKVFLLFDVLICYNVGSNYNIEKSKMVFYEKN